MLCIIFILDEMVQLIVADVQLSAEMMHAYHFDANCYFSYTVFGKCYSLLYCDVECIAAFSLIG